MLPGAFQTPLVIGGSDEGKKSNVRTGAEQLSLIIEISQQYSQSVGFYCILSG